MKKMIVIFIISMLLMASCQATIQRKVEVSVAQTVAAIPTQTPFPTPTTNPLPEPFQEQAYEFMQSGSVVAGALTQGVTYVELRQLVNEARGSYELAVAMWPETISKESMTYFDKAFEGLDLTLYLWKLKIGEKDEPVEPDVNRFQDFVDYTDILITKKHPSNFIVPQYQNKEYVTFDNVEILMTIATDYYRNGQEQLLSILEE